MSAYSHCSAGVLGFEPHMSTRLRGPVAYSQSYGLCSSQQFSHSQDPRQRSVFCLFLFQSLKKSLPMDSRGCKVWSYITRCALVPPCPGSQCPAVPCPVSRCAPAVPQLPRCPAVPLPRLCPSCAPAAPLPCCPAAPLSRGAPVPTPPAATCGAPPAAPHLPLPMPVNILV
eukprot:COSAG01_NODE_8895_length_2623_cov_35.397781_4_plen_171_part_00